MKILVPPLAPFPLLEQQEAEVPTHVGARWAVRERLAGHRLARDGISLVHIRGCEVQPRGRVGGCECGTPPQGRAGLLEPVLPPQEEAEIEQGCGKVGRDTDAALVERERAVLVAAGQCHVARHVAHVRIVAGRGERDVDHGRRLRHIAPAEVGRRRAARGDRGGGGPERHGKRSEGKEKGTSHQIWRR
jgi:hypothetical protein